VIGFWWALTAAAQDDGPQVRAVRLADGRAYVAQVVATLPEGIALRVPQGTLTVPYEQLVDVSPLDAADYDRQDPWVVLLAAPGDGAAARLLDAMPQVVIWTPTGTVGEPSGPIDLADAEQAALRSCQLDAACMAGALGQGANAHWVVSLDSAGQVVGQVTRSDTAAVGGPLTSDDAGWRAIHLALGLDAPSGPSPIALTPPRLARTPAPALRYLPVPGLPALAAGQGGRFALALGTAVPLTAAWVGAVGTQATSLPEGAAWSAVGFYAVSVLTSELFAPRVDARRRDP
jgi:hypothetical protein